LGVARVGGVRYNVLSPVGPAARRQTDVLPAARVVVRVGAAGGAVDLSLIDERGTGRDAGRGRGVYVLSPRAAAYLVGGG